MQKVIEEMRIVINSSAVKKPHSRLSWAKCGSWHTKSLSVNLFSSYPLSVALNGVKEEKKIIEREYHEMDRD